MLIHAWASRYNCVLNVIPTLASQLNIAELAVLVRYREGEVRYDHIHKIMQEYGYHDFAFQPEHFRFLRCLVGFRNPSFTQLY